MIIYIVMESQRYNYAEYNRDIPRAAFRDPGKALAERDRLRETEGNMFIDFSVKEVELR